MELSASDPEAFKAFLLASMAGLRRAEIDKLEWTAFDWQLEKVQIGVTEHLAIKSQGSIGDVDLEPQVMKIFKNFYEQGIGPFVIESRVKPRRCLPIPIVVASALLSVSLIGSESMG